MKKTLKKVLVLFALITVLTAICVFSASAVSCGDGKHTIVETYHAPTCTEPGYTEYTCTMCDFKGVSERTDAPLGHDFKGVDYTYEAVGDYYKRGKLCQRAECAKTIYDTHIENNQAVYDRYYLVQLVNPFAADTYWEEITHAEVIKTHKEMLVKTKVNAEYGNWYILGGETLESYITETLGHRNYTDWMNTVNNTNIVRRLKDKAYGKYDLVGWAYSKLESGEYTDSDIVDFAATAVTANTKLYATFEGDETVTYEVQYRDGNKVFLTKIFDVRHGKAASDDIFLPEYDENGEFVRYNNEKLDKAEDVMAYYEFSGWSPSREAIYGNTDIIAQYDTIKKEYDYVFYTWDADKGEYTDSGVRARAKYGYPLTYVYEDGTVLTEAQIKAFTAKDKDRSYIYSWDGNWKMLNRDFYVTSMSSSVPNGTLDSRYEDEEGYAPTILIPTYNRRQVLYTTYVTIKFDNSVDFEGSTEEYDTETYLNGLNVQIVDADGQLIAKGTANRVEGTNYAQFACSLYDSASYTVTVTSVRGKYSGTTTLSRTYVYDFNAPVHISVGLTVDQGYIDGQGCRCICHNSMFKPIWVKILNLLYNLLNVKYVCCDDMYVSIGGLLDYTK